MESIKVRSHHINNVLSWLTMPDCRALSISELYNGEQKEFSEKVIESFEKGELKYIEITKGIDDICKLCPFEKRKDNCEEDDNITVLNKKEFNSGEYTIEEILKHFDKEGFYFQLRDKYQSNF
jgi:hypothetical protein